jgi:hypothetical protein
MVYIQHITQEEEEEEEGNKTLCLNTIGIDTLSLQDSSNNN